MGDGPRHGKFRDLNDVTRKLRQSIKNIGEQFINRLLKDFDRYRKHSGDVDSSVNIVEGKIKKEFSELNKQFRAAKKKHEGSR